MQKEKALFAKGLYISLLELELIEGIPINS